MHLPLIDLIFCGPAAVHAAALPLLLHATTAAVCRAVCTHPTRGSCGSMASTGCWCKHESRYQEAEAGTQVGASLWMRASSLLGEPHQRR